MTDDSLRILRAALYAGGIFAKMRNADISDEDLELVTPTIDEPGAVSLALNLAIAALVLDSSDAAWAAIRERFHRSDSLLEDRDLSGINALFDELLGAIPRNSEIGIKRLKHLANETIGLATVQDRRAMVVDAVAEAAADKPGGFRRRSFISDLDRYERAFAALDPAFVSEVLGKVVENPNGKGQLGWHGAAAKFAVAVGAFGDTNERNSKEAFRQACEAAEKASLARQREASAAIARRDNRKE